MLGHYIKNPDRRFEGILFWKKNSEIFKFITLLLEILYKRNHYPCKFHEIVLHPSEILKPNMKTYCMEIQHDIFSINPRNFISVSVDPGISIWYFFNVHKNTIPYIYIIVCFIIFYWQEMAFKFISLWNLLWSYSL